MSTNPQIEKDNKMDHTNDLEQIKNDINVLKKDAQALDSKVVDLSNYSNNGTVVGATWDSSGKYGGAYSFSGDGDCINIGTDVSLNNFSDSMSIEAWIYLKGAGADGYQIIVGKEIWDDNGINDSYVFNINETYFISFGVYVNNDGKY